MQDKEFLAFWRNNFYETLHFISCVVQVFNGLQSSQLLLIFFGQLVSNLLMIVEQKQLSEIRNQEIVKEKAIIKSLELDVRIAVCFIDC